MTSEHSLVSWQVEHADAELHFEITNTGKTTADNVYCALHLEEPRLVDLLYGDPSSIEPAEEDPGQSAPDAPEGLQTASNGAAGSHQAPQEDSPAAEGHLARRSWWRRIFG
jgi:hypothetical protein